MLTNLNFKFKKEETGIGNRPIENMVALVIGEPMGGFKGIVSMESQPPRPIIRRALKAARKKL